MNKQKLNKQTQAVDGKLKAEIAGALARAYCYVENSKKQMDSDLLKAMGKELENVLFKAQQEAISTQLEEIIAMVEEMKKEMKPSIRSLRFNNCPKCGQEINREWVDREVLEIGKETLSDFLNQLNQMKGENENNPI